MGQLDLILGLCLAVTVFSGALLDLRSRRIPNWLTVSALIAALSVRLIWGGGAEFRSGALAASIGLGVSFPLFAARALGGGDVKFLTAVCAILGMDHIWASLAATAIAGGVLSLLVAIRRGAVQRTFVLMGRLVQSLVSRMTRGEYSLPPQTLSTPGALTVPYGVAIAVGAVVGFYW